MFMTHKFETLLYAIFFTMWVVRIYYKLYDKKIRRYVLTIGFLIIFWMIIRITKSVIDINCLERYCWYLYYVSLIFIPAIFYVCCNSILSGINKYRKILIYMFSFILLALVLTNDLHELVFKFNDGLQLYDDYSYSIGYYIISVWIFYLFGGGMIKLAINRVKIHKDIKVFTPIIVLLLGIIYTVLYVLGIKPFSSMNMSIVNSVLICLGIELIFYLDLMPNNSRYIRTFENSNLDIMIISIDGKTIYKTNSFNDIPKEIMRDIKNNDIKSSYNYGNINYKLKRNEDSFVILKSDLSLLNKLKKEIKSKQRKLLKQEKSIKLEEKTKKELYEISLRKDTVSKIENKLDEKKEEINKILDKKNITDADLANIKNIIIYSKKKSALIISDLNDDVYNEEDIKVVLSELVNSVSNVNSLIIVKDKLSINAYYLSIIYDILFELVGALDDRDIVIYILGDKNHIKLKVMAQGSESIINKLKIEDNVTVKENIFDTDTEILFTIKGA